MSTTAIFDTTYSCLSSFDQLTPIYGESTVARSIDTARDASDFLGLRNSFSLWIDYTGALSLMDSSLDARLSDLLDISSMVIELLEMILRNLGRGKLLACHAGLVHPVREEG